MVAEKMPIMMNTKLPPTPFAFSEWYTKRAKGPVEPYWTAFNEQRITLSTALSGTQTVYFVGNSTSGVSVL